MTSVELEKPTSKSKNYKIDRRTLDDRYRWFRVELLCTTTYQLIDYVFRGMTSQETRTADLKKTLFEKEDYVLCHCVVNDVDWDTALAGVASTLLSLIYQISGLDESDLPAQAAIQWIQTDSGMLEVLAMTALPGLDLYTLRTCDIGDYYRYLLAGKEMFEVIYQRKAEQQQPGQVQASMGPGTVQRNKSLPTNPGEIGHETEQFSWKRR